jgi:hypothetical protein
MGQGSAQNGLDVDHQPVLRFQNGLIRALDLALPLNLERTKVFVLMVSLDLLAKLGLGALACALPEKMELGPTKWVFIIPPLRAGVSLAQMGLISPHV